MESKDKLSLIIGGSLIATTCSVLYYFYSKYNSNIENKENKTEDEGLDNEKEKEKKLSSKIKKEISNIKENDKYLDNKTSNTKTENESLHTNTKSNKNFEVIEINQLSEVLRIIVNSAFENIFLSYEACKLDYNYKDGMYKGENMQLIGTDVNFFKKEVIYKIAEDNYRIIQKHFSPENYNKSLQYYLQNNK